VIGEDLLDRLVVSRVENPHGRDATGAESIAASTVGAVEDVLSLFAPGTTRAADGMLLLGGCRADELAAEHGTPALVVDEVALRARAREYRDELAARWPRSRVVFASKAFPSTAVQRVMVEEGLGLDVAGGGEIVTGLRAGADPSLLVLHGNAKTDVELRMAVDEGIGLVVVDNEDDVDRLEALVPAGRVQDVLVRIIPGVTAETHAHVLTGHEASKFGLAPAAATKVIARIESIRRLRMQGVHVHVGSQILAVEPFAAAVRAVASLGEFPVYDVGGGLGVRYTHPDDPPTVGEYLDAVVGAAREHLPNDAELIVEPGRSLVARAATTLYRVVTVKRGARTFVAVDGGMGDNLEVALYGQRFEAVLANRPSAGVESESVVVVGRHCESGDLLVDGVDLPAPRVGDLLAVPVTGAYCFTMANNYNGNRRLPVVFASGGRSRTVVRRETWDDLLARDVER
jgi:diaminopimelate decarboxylase